jgi:Gp5 N-terminal OB domain
MIMNWWTGVVEDRDDPEKLGRCRVRIFGWHTEDTKLLPTNELAWALPMQSVTSAAASGVGSTPIGIVTGSWVVGFFLDGDEGQQPVIMGTIAGKPSPNTLALEKQQQENTSQNYIKDQTGKPIYDQLGNAINSNTDIISEQDTLKPLK